MGRRRWRGPPHVGATRPTQLPVWRLLRIVARYPPFKADFMRVREIQTRATKSCCHVGCKRLGNSNMERRENRAFICLTAAMPTWRRSHTR